MHVPRKNLEVSVVDGATVGDFRFSSIFVFANFLRRMHIILITKTKQRNEEKRKPIFRRIWCHGVLSLEKWNGEVEKISGLGSCTALAIGP